MEHYPPPYGGAAHEFQLNEGYIGRFFGLPGLPLPIHPTQSYELIAALLAAFIALFLLIKKAPAGVPLAAFGLTLSALRFIIFFFRAYPGLNGAALFVRGPLAFILSALIFGTLLIVSLARSKSQADCFIPVPGNGSPPV